MMSWEADSTPSFRVHRRWTRSPLLTIIFLVTIIRNSQQLDLGKDIYISLEVQDPVLRPGFLLQPGNLFACTIQNSEIEFDIQVIFTRHKNLSKCCKTIVFHLTACRSFLALIGRTIMQMSGFCSKRSLSISVRIQNVMDGHDLFGSF